MRQTISQFDAAQVQLERALTLYLESSDYLSCITLAGAAEEVLGHMVEATGKKHSLSGNAKVYAWLNSKLGGSHLTDREAVTALNEVRDWLKHYKNGAALSLDPKESAQEMLERAVYDMLVLTNSETDLMRRFHRDVVGDV
jgi:hypothetical protein